MMDRHSVQILLAQTLENYQRCGVRWVSNDGEIPSDWKDTIASLTVEASDISLLKAESAQSTSVQSTGITPPKNVAHPVSSPKSSRLPPVARPEAMHEAMQVPSAPTGTWESPELDDAARHNLFQILDQEIRACRKCTEICPYRRQTVFGEGPIRPTVCFMGEAPGADEDAQGRPFVGRAGQLLTQIIGAMKLKREEVYILNSLKCRPPGNRNPSPDEILNCYPFVESQLETLRPKYIVCLGAIAARSLLKRDTPVGQMRGRFYQYRGARVLVTYHPSYLLRNENAKRLVWEDMQLLMRELGISLPPKK
jgi:uracil-DNA glycosylase